jgi:uncharacterized protein
MTAQIDPIPFEPSDADTDPAASEARRDARGTTGLSVNDRQLAALSHLAALVAALITSWFAGIAGGFAALVVWFVVRDRSAFAAEHAKEALNFNLSMFIYAVAAVLLVVFTLGIGLIVALPLWALMAVAWIVLTIIAAFKAYDGEIYRYPLTLRLV